MIIKKIKKICSEIFRKKSVIKIDIIDSYLKNGRIPWTIGYNEYKTKQINETLLNQGLVSTIIKLKNIPKMYGYGIDERIVEYPWIYSNISDDKGKLLDAGSTFNFDYILDLDKIKNKDLFIYTYYPEQTNFNHKKISYVYGDLRKTPFMNDYFDEIVCQSTIEHINMDNSIYGYTQEQPANHKDIGFKEAVSELIRILKPEGLLLITFPYGKYENHGFFQQFDKELLDELLTVFNDKGIYELEFFKYNPNGWRFTNPEELKEEVAFNPHTGKGKKNDNAAHSRGIACVKFVKKHI